MKRRRRALLRPTFAILLAFLTVILPLEGAWPAFLNTQTAQAVGGYDAQYVYGPNSFDNTVRWNATSSFLSVDKFVEDAADGILFAMHTGTGTIYYCDESTGCDIDTDWTSYSTPDNPSTLVPEIFTGLNIVGTTLYAGSSGTGNITPTDFGKVYRCILSSGCDETSDWSQALDTQYFNPSFGIYAINGFAEAGGYLYAIGSGGVQCITQCPPGFGFLYYQLSNLREHSIYRCALASSCNSDSDWTLIVDEASARGNLIVADPISDVLYIGLEDSNGSGYLGRCDHQGTGCDDPSEWTNLFVGEIGALYSIAVDEYNEVIYAGGYGTGESGVLSKIMYCDIGAGPCDDSGDWFVSLDTALVGESPNSIFWDDIRNFMYVGTNSKIIRCDPGVVGICDGDTTWHVASSDDASYALVRDTNNDRLFSAGNSDIYRCTAGASCKESEFRNGLARDTAYDSTHNRLFASDRYKNRVLVYDLASVTNGEVPVYVVGQPNFLTTSSNFPSTSSASLNGPNTLAYDNTQNILYVTDSGNNRVLKYNGNAISSGMGAVAIVGQAADNVGDCNQGGSRDANTLCDPEGVSVDYDNHLFISDTGNSRVLEYDISDGLDAFDESAVDVYGQGAGIDFTTADSGLSDELLSTPSGIFAEIYTGTLWVADYSNSRVLGFLIGSHTASVVYGQDTFNDGDCNKGASPDANTLCSPDDVGFIESGGSERLLVADSSNGRVMVFDVSGTFNGEAIDVYGVPDFTTYGGGAAQDSLSAPSGIDYDEGVGRLFVGDAGNERVMQFGAPGGTSLPTPGDGEIVGQCAGWPSPHVEIAWSENPPPGSDVPNVNSVLRGVDSQSNDWFFGGPDSIDGTHIDGSPADAATEPFDYDLKDTSVLVGHTYNYYAKYRPETPTSNTYTVTINADSCGGTPNPNPGGHLGVNSDFLTSSAPSAPSDHTIRFITGGYIPSGSRIEYVFDPAFDMSAVTVSDLNFYYGEQAPLDLTQMCSTDPDIPAADISGNTITITLCSGFELSQYSLTILQVTNGVIINPPTVGTYGIRLAAYDENDVLLAEDDPFIAIVYPVDLNAYVAPSFTFVIDGMTGSEAIDDQTVASASTALYAGFGTLTAGTPVMMGSSLSVSTNAANGFTVTVQENHNMVASSGADIDSFKDGATQYPAATWSTPVGTLGSETTYGHFGVTTEDSDTISATASVTSTTDGEWIGLTPGTARTIWSNSGPADGEMQDVGHIDVGYRVQITSLQEAGRYQNRLMYIATPVF